MIAAVDLAHSATIATRDIAGFALIAAHWPGLSVINPWEWP
jgi:hypothetical protein